MIYNMIDYIEKAIEKGVSVGGNPQTVIVKHQLTNEYIRYQVIFEALHFDSRIVNGLTNIAEFAIMTIDIRTNLDFGRAAYIEVINETNNILEIIEIQKDYSQIGTLAIVIAEYLVSF